MTAWIEATRKGKCSRCHRDIKPGEQLFIKSRGVYMCELCGSLAEHEVPEVGSIQQGVLADLSALPEEASSTTLAQAMLYMARQIDADEVAPRDVAPLNKELRQNLAALKELFPETSDDDVTDQARSARDKFLGATFEEPYQP